MLDHVTALGLNAGVPNTDAQSPLPFQGLVSFKGPHLSQCFQERRLRFCDLGAGGGKKTVRSLQRSGMATNPEGQLISSCLSCSGHLLLTLLSNLTVLLLCLSKAHSPSTCLSDPDLLTPTLCDACMRMPGLNVFSWSPHFQPPPHSVLGKCPHEFSSLWF